MNLMRGYLLFNIIGTAFSAVLMSLMDEDVIAVISFGAFVMEFIVLIMDIKDEKEETV